MKRVLIILFSFLFMAAWANAATFYGNLEDPVSPGYIDIDKPDEDHVMLFLDRYGEEYEVNILQWKAGRDGLVWLELEFDPPVEKPKALDVGSVTLHLDKKDSANFMEFMRKDENYGTE